ncbi:hypothetical protein JI721_04530 [Alicyclobacillus cycloheptanicus]|uniref:Uncharacterized protein n=1 Tax=Alicyclobacillus cycloheptanicus TaxID=1457 RepID=A0ABT9XII1_9BACL|nr:hypothetical protein [Alicyclobacillus cycloheptanicus]MDQ0190124.1 hypothetical protein [Alicyclobacillus cycloheptanicus]WDM02096.1 hypothetical protein JI721_04530 [Alicyclobacillus cycloheptanicus]
MFTAERVTKKALAFAGAVLAGVVLTGTAAFAASSLKAVKAQAQSGINYNGVKGDRLVYQKTTYAELYAIQQALKNQGIQNQWNGTSGQFTIQTPTEVQWMQKIFAAATQLSSSDQVQVMKELAAIESPSHTESAAQRIADLSQLYQDIEQSLATTGTPADPLGGLLSTLTNALGLGGLLGQ